jgi:hypothetical protein
MDPMNVPGVPQAANRFTDHRASSSTAGSLENIIIGSEEVPSIVLFRTVLRILACRLETSTTVSRCFLRVWVIESLFCRIVILSHPVLEGKPNANHVRARISYSRTQQLHNMDIIT